jgi:hypothetical protein
MPVVFCCKVPVIFATKCPVNYLAAATKWISFKRDSWTRLTQFQEALRLKPDFRPAQDDLDNVEALVRQLEGHK